MNAPRRFLTAASLFDGHDAAINLIRRLIQDAGGEVVHMGHDRSVEEIVIAARQEDPHAIALSSYQGGHIAYFTYLLERLKEEGLGHIRVFGGGGGTILPEEARELERRGVARIFRPEDGTDKGLEGIISEVFDLCDVEPSSLKSNKGEGALARALTRIETGNLEEGEAPSKGALVVGFTGTGGAGKSSLIDELVLRLRRQEPHRQIAILAADPTRERTGGALLGDRIRMNAIYDGGVFMRSLAARRERPLIEIVASAVERTKAAGYDLVMVETPGIGQADNPLGDLCDLSLYVMTSDYGAPSQLEKIEMLDRADLVVLNKFDHRAGEDALREVRRQVRRLRSKGEGTLEEQPVYPTIASQYADKGVDALATEIERLLSGGDGERTHPVVSARQHLIPSDRERYLAEIAQVVRHRRKRVSSLSGRVRLAEALATLLIDDGTPPPSGFVPFPSPQGTLQERYNDALSGMGESASVSLRAYDETAKRYGGDTATYSVRGNEIRVPASTESLSGLRIPKVALPRFSSWSDRLEWIAQENVPGAFPYTQGVYPFRRTGEAPTRMFAGEGPPERTNARFHLLAEGQPATRLSTAFDSPTLYGHNPEPRPDVLGKVGESGVSIATLDDMKRLYAGFDLCAPTTSVSMTINGPAPMLLAMFLNTAIDDKRGRFEDEKGREATPEEALALRKKALQRVRGTVQADILKEDQAQNTCIFGTPFALRMMGDIQSWFIQEGVRNFYSVSISGYHIAEAGANPISQLAFTLANGFTYVEHYLSRGMEIDDFARNLSFFFSSGMDPEYQVLGRVARRIWAVALRDRYGAGERAQKLKYHIQTSGRSLHAQEIQFNDIRTTLQALMAYFDRCDSLHTNAYDEAITTPTPESVRRALAIQQIIQREFGTAQCENPLQGGFLVEELTDLVEEAVLTEFERLSRRGGVLGAMELGYQRGKIQEESLHYERLKHSGELPLIGVNTFLGDDPQIETPKNVTRATEEEKDLCVARCIAFEGDHAKEAPEALSRLQYAALEGKNLFEVLMETVRVASLGQITKALYGAGGRYRRSL